MTSQDRENPLYAFLDESGDLAFNTKGTRYFILTCVTMMRPFPLYAELEDLKYSLIEQGEFVDHFHCSQDKRFIREEVFNRIEGSLKDVRVDCLIVDKRRTESALTSPGKFYPGMLGHLLRYVFPRVVTDATKEVIVITDTIPVREKRSSIEKAVKVTLASMLDAEHRYQLLHHSSRSHFGLQVADYFSWALFKKYEDGKLHHYSRIRSAIQSEFSIFGRGATENR